MKSNSKREGPNLFVYYADALIGSLRAEMSEPGDLRYSGGEYFIRKPDHWLKITIPTPAQDSKAHGLALLELIKQCR